MPYRIVKFETGRSYQIVNKGKGGMRIFYDETDYRRFKLLMTRHGAGRVKVYVYALVWNHFHFLLRQVSDGGIEGFMRALQMPYTRFINQKHGRRGGLYKGTFWAEKIRDRRHFYNVMDYIMRNPVKHKMCNLGLDGVSGVGCGEKEEGGMREGREGEAGRDYY